MASELLVKAQSPHRGAISNVKPVGWVWGSEEALPKFVRISVTNGSFGNAEDWSQAWVRDVQMTVDTSSASQVTLTFSGTPARQSDGLGKVTATELQPLLDDWSMVVNNNGDNAVTVTVNIFNAAVSSGYWGFDISAATFSDLGIVNGRQQVEINYSATGWSPNVVGARIVQRGAEVLANNGTVARFAVPISDLEAELRNDLNEYKKRIAIRRYQITQSGVDAAVNNGGALSVTESEVLANLVDLTQI